MVRKDSLWYGDIEYADRPRMGHSNQERERGSGTQIVKAFPLALRALPRDPTAFGRREAFWRRER